MRCARRSPPRRFSSSPPRISCSARCSSATPFASMPALSPLRALATGEWLAALPGIVPWSAAALPETEARIAFAFSGLALAGCAIVAASRERAAARALCVVATTVAISFALVLAQLRWPPNGEGGRVLYAIGAIAVLGLALPLATAGPRLRALAWLCATVLLASEYLLAHEGVERWVQAGRDARALAAALAETAASTARGRLRVRRDPRPCRRDSVRAQRAGRIHPSSGAGAAAVVAADRADARWARAMAGPVRARHRRPSAARAARKRRRQSADAESVAAVRTARPLLLLESARARTCAAAVDSRRGACEVGRDLGTRARRRGLRFREKTSSSRATSQRGAAGRRR